MTIRILTMLLLVFWHSVALAQDQKEPASEAEREAISGLVARAETLSGKGTEDYDVGVYYATIHLGLSRLSGRLESQMRGGATGDFDPTSISPDAEVAERIAENERAQAAMDDLLAQSELGLRIINGRLAEMGQFTSTIALVDGNNSRACTAVVVEEGWILTAAHCYCDLGIGAGRTVFARFGNPTVTTSTPTTRILGGEMRNPNFCSERVSGTICSPDIALLRYERADTPHEIQIASIADEAIAAAHVANSRPNSTIVGFGATRSQGAGGAQGATFSASGINPKAYGFVPLVEECRPQISCNQTTDRRACAIGVDIQLIDRISGVDTCKGDSGGPVYLPGALFNPQVIAITSRAVSRFGGCGKGGIYSKTYTNDIRNWIEEAKERLEL